MRQGFKGRALCRLSAVTLGLAMLDACGAATDDVAQAEGEGHDEAGDAGPDDEGAIDGALRDGEVTDGGDGAGGADDATGATDRDGEQAADAGGRDDSPADDDDLDDEECYDCCGDCDPDDDVVDDVCAPGVPATSQVPRLANAEYDNTIRDLLEITELTALGGQPPSWVLATEQRGAITEVVWEGYQLAAETIAHQAVLEPQPRARFLGCSLDDEGFDCLKEAIPRFGRRAFRRPLTEAEVARFVALVDDAALITETGSPEEAAEVLLTAFLISPSFLQRAELSETAGDDGALLLSSHEVAARLSYTLWGSMPDAILDAAADAGDLLTPEEIFAQAQRMIQDSKTAVAVAAFNDRWLRMEDNGVWQPREHDRELFPEFDAATAESAIEETRRVLGAVFAEGGTFQDLLLTNMAFVNAATAPLYGLAAEEFSQSLTRTELTGRPGFLTRAGFLSSFSGFSDTAPMRRGAFLLSRIVGVDVGPPDPIAVATLPPDFTEVETNRQRADLMTAAPECAGCHHAYINPLGFVMEAYDPVGKEQTYEAQTGAPIDTVAEVMLSLRGEPVTIATPAELMAAIAVAPAAHRYYATQWVTHAYRRVPTPPDLCVVNALTSRVATGSYPIADLLADLTQADFFNKRAVEVIP